MAIASALYYFTTGSLRGDSIVLFLKTPAAPAANIPESSIPRFCWQTKSQTMSQNRWFWLILFPCFVCPLRPECFLIWDRSARCQQVWEDSDPAGSFWSTTWIAQSRLLLESDKWLGPVWLHIYVHLSRIGPLSWKAFWWVAARIVRRPAISLLCLQQSRPFCRPRTTRDAQRMLDTAHHSSNRTTDSTSAHSKPFTDSFHFISFSEIAWPRRIGLTLRVCITIQLRILLFQASWFWSSLSDIDCMHRTFWHLRQREGPESLLLARSLILLLCPEAVCVQLRAQALELLIALSPFPATVKSASMVFTGMNSTDLATC